MGYERMNLQKDREFVPLVEEGHWDVELGLRIRRSEGNVLKI